MTEPSHWLTDRLARAPASLRAHVLDALGPVEPGLDGQAFLTRLQATGERLLDEARRDGQDRRSALTLLAADALITLAAEWVAASDPARLASFGS